MKGLLSSDFINVSWRFCDHFKELRGKLLNVLFIAYSIENADDYLKAQKNALKKAFNVNKIIDLTFDYKFNDEIDIIFVTGGYHFDRLIENLINFNQLDKILNLIENGTVYIGESVGAVIAGNYSYPYFFEKIKKEDIGEINKTRKGFTGLRLLDFVVIPHTSRFRFPMNFKEGTPTYRVLNKTSKGISPLSRNLKIAKELKKMNVPYITYGENEALLVVDRKVKKLRFDWSKFAVLKNKTTSDEKKLLQSK